MLLLIFFQVAQFQQNPQKQIDRSHHWKQLESFIAHLFTFAWNEKVNLTVFYFSRLFCAQLALLFLAFKFSGLMAPHIALINSASVKPHNRCAGLALESTDVDKMFSVTSLDWCEACSATRMNYLPFCCVTILAFRDLKMGIKVKIVKINRIIWLRNNALLNTFTLLELAQSWILSATRTACFIFK